MAEPVDNVDLGTLGAEIFALVEELFPICRSVTGNGVRETLRILGKTMPLQVTEVPSGTPVLDWTVPREWNIREAWIAAPGGRRVVDFRDSNLHVVSYSVPVRVRLPLERLRPHLHTLPDHPDWVPYRTSHYEESWGFCLTERQREALPDGEYEVCIDSSLEPGHLTYGELVLPGRSEEEVLISTHVCHPSLCDDNLSGIAVSLFLARHLARFESRRYTYRFLYAPGTIGAITWLSRNRERAPRIRHGLTLSCLGDDRPFTYKKTLPGQAEIDRVVAHVLAERRQAHHVIDYFPYGYDERQFNSPGFRLPVGSLMRGRHGQFPEYHTSADNLDFVSAPRLAESWALCRDVLEVLEGNRAYRNLQPFGEPQLGRRGLYRATGGTELPGLELAMLWVLCLADGEHSLLDVADRAGIEFRVARTAADLLEQHALLEEVQQNPAPGAGKPL
jgi:aminopeptidase-like protein